MAAMWTPETSAAARAERPPSARSETDLVDGLRAGDANAFEHFFAIYRTPVYNLAVRLLRDTEEAKDATQETFLKAFQQLPRQNGDLSLAPWLYRVAVNTCFDRLREQRRHPTASLDEHGEQTHPTDQFAQAETDRLVEETLRRLSQRHRAVLVLKDLHGLTHEEIAAVLGISRGAAETLLFRARESFRSVFEELSLAPQSSTGCAYARSLALALVGRDVSQRRWREITAHARSCPECRRSLRLRGGLAMGLALFVRKLAPPATLGPPVALAAATPASAPALGGASAAGVLAKLAAMLGGKAAVAAVAAVGVAVAGGTVAYTQLASGDRARRHVAPAAVAAAHATIPPGKVKAGNAATLAPPHRGARSRALAARAAAKDKRDKAKARGHSAARKAAPGSGAERARASGAVKTHGTAKGGAKAHAKAGHISQKEGVAGARTPSSRADPARGHDGSR
jgi:RNA polymerase sigma-70 factor (ECF subfamily)